MVTDSLGYSIGAVITLSVIGYFVYKVNKWITIQVRKRTDKLHNNIHNKLNGDDNYGN
jgi:hypothetical protein